MQIDSSGSMYSSLDCRRGCIINGSIFS